MKRLVFGKGFPILAAFILSFSVSPQSLYAADDYPARPITMLIGYAAGGGTDIIARLLSETAGKTLNQPIPPVNKPGGASSVALSLLMNEKPDGYTLGILPVGGVISALLRKVPYDPVKDFTPIMQFAEYQFGLVVRADSPWMTVQQFIDYAKKNPNKIRYASSGIGTGGHLAMERLAIANGIKWLHVPYDGDAPSCTALMGGHVDASTGSSGTWKSYVEAGKFRFLASYLEKRFSFAPEVPCLAELGYNIIASSFIGVVGPKGMPEPIVGKLNEAFRKATEDPNFIKTAEKLGISIVYRGPQDLKKLVQKTVDEESKLIQKLGTKVKN